MERPSRLASIDVLRGLVMVLMALDHARDFFHDARIVPEHELEPGAALFLTRWVTHFCAPVFVFLAGTSVFLWRERGGKSARQVAGYLISRGAWLLALEFTVVHFSWFFAFPGILFAQVIAAIGVSMIALGLLAWLPWRAVLAVGLLIVAGHNLFGPDPPVDWSQPPAWSWSLLHDEGYAAFPNGWLLIVKYPPLPWVGVLFAGYGFGAVFTLADGARRRALLAIGAGATALFVALRATSTYGDPIPWSEQEHGGSALLTFLNCEKYPPSLLFTLMTLGPSILFLWAVDRGAGAVGRVLEVFGRVPLFYYLAHILLIHGASHLWYLARDGSAPSLLMGGFSESYGTLPLWVSYLAWALAVALLYFPCRWYAGLRRRSPLLTYL